jgi:hypothetical protein
MEVNHYNYKKQIERKKLLAAALKDYRIELSNIDSGLFHLLMDKLNAEEHPLALFNLTFFIFDNARWEVEGLQEKPGNNDLLVFVNCKDTFSRQDSLIIPADHFDNGFTESDLYTRAERFALKAKEKRQVRPDFELRERAILAHLLEKYGLPENYKGPDHE